MCRLPYVSVAAVALMLLLSGSAPMASDPIARIDALLLAKDYGAAVSLAKDAAEQGQVEAEFRYGLFYWHGVGVSQNYLESLHWVTLAALSGHERAIAARKLILPSVDQPNWPKALDWARQRLQKAAEAGDNSVLIALSRSYSADFGFENPVEEYYWACLSVAVGDESLHKRRDALSKKIVITDAAKVQDRMVAWLEKFRPKKAE